MQEWELKKILDDIINYAYPDTPERKKYHMFYIVLMKDKLWRSKHGDYIPMEKTIRIGNLYRDSCLIVKTVLHEMAHHIDMCRTGSCGHGKSFYEEYRRLMYAAFDMRILNPEEVIRHEEESQDSGKVKRMAMEYQPREKPAYMPDKARVVLKNAYEKKEVIKKNGYMYDPGTKVWTKIVENGLLESEKLWLEKEKITYEVRCAAKVDLSVKKMIYAAGNTYEYREKLKKNGFRYDAEKKMWKKKIENSHEVKMYKTIFPKIKFITN